jgi:hypothetical protein
LIILPVYLLGRPVKIIAVAVFNEVTDLDIFHQWADSHNSALIERLFIVNVDYVRDIANLGLHNYPVS